MRKTEERRLCLEKTRELDAYKKFEGVLKDTLLAMVVDGAVARNIGAKECRETLTEMMAAFAEVFPNWQDAYSFADDYFIHNAATAEDRIKQMLSQ